MAVFTTAVPQIPSAMRADTSSFAALRQTLIRLARRLNDPYRPEKYYMRGPGPKWHAKHGTQRSQP